MRPLVLREIADTLGLHESTISRVTTQKYMLTPHGMFELKYFFGSHVATEAGGEASSTAIRALIVQLTGAEDPKNPLSDSKIADMLGEQGMVIARRTVAKYREALKILPSAPQVFVVFRFLCVPDRRPAQPIIFMSGMNTHQRTSSRSDTTIVIDKRTGRVKRHFDQVIDIAVILP